MKRTTIILTTLFLVSIAGKQSFSQMWAIQDANTLFNARAYQMAIPMYEKLASYKNADAMLTYKLAECYMETKNYKKAEETYAKLKGNETLPLEYYLNYGHVLMYLGNYDTAYAYFRVYKQIGGSHPNIDTYMQSAKWAKAHKDDKNTDYTFAETPYAVEGLYIGGGYFYDDLVFSKPNIKKDEKDKVIYPQYKVNLVPEEDGGTGIGREIITSDTTKFYIGSPTFNKEKTAVYYTKTESNEVFVKPKNYEEESISTSGINTLNIYKAVIVDNTWLFEEPLAINSREFSTMHPSLSSDGKRLYFSTNRPGGQGGYDIWFIMKVAGEWGDNPINCGSKINTPNDEMFPYIYEDSILYFASNGHVGFGGADIYKSSLRGQEWTEPKNMGKGFNSSKDDFGMVFKDRRNGVFASNRGKESTIDQLFSFSEIVDYKTGSGQIFDQLTQYYIPYATIELFVDTELVATVTADNKGHWSYNKFDPDLYYKIKGSADNYLPDSIKFDPAKPKRDSLNLYLNQSLESGDLLTLNNILFEYDKYSLLPESKTILDRVAILLKSSEATVQLGAHTDCRGSDEYNLTLSINRAKSCVDYLVLKGLPSDRITYKGFGETQLKNKCDDDVRCSEEEHAINRRVEVKVMDLPPEMQEQVIKKDVIDELYNIN